MGSILSRFFLLILKSIFFLSLLILAPLSNGFALSSGNCSLYTLAEVFVPGLGFGLTGQLDKAAVFAGLGYPARGHASRALASEFFQDDPETIYQTKEADQSESGKYEIEVRMNRETWDYQYYGRIASNLTLMSVYDLYETSCESDPDRKLYVEMLAPFNIVHFYDKWQFWASMAVAASAYSTFEESNKIDWYLYRGLKESRIRGETYPSMYSTGVGEEMFFRGFIQQAFYDYYKQGSSPAASRHFAILSSAAVFGLAHNGVGGSASPSAAFLAGLFLGYTYQPSPEEFDLTTVSAIHSWWDIIVSYAWINHAKFHSEDGDAPTTPVPILNIALRF